jgi:cobalt/nickel transport system permease protein
LIPLLLFFAAALIISPEYGFSRDLEIFLDLSIKSGLCFLCIAYFSLTTDFYSLIRGLQAFKIPHIFSGILLFGYNYGILLIREVKRIQNAKESRSPKRSSKIKEIKLGAHLAPMLVFKTLERSGKIYAAMLSRGFNGEIRGLRKPVMTYKDVVFVCLFVGLLITGIKFL